MLSSNLSKLEVKVELIKLKLEDRPTEVRCDSNNVLKLFSTPATLALDIFAFSVTMLSTNDNGFPVLLIRDAIAFVIGVMFAVIFFSAANEPPGITLTNDSVASPILPVTVATKGAVNLLGSNLIS